MKLDLVEFIKKHITFNKEYNPATGETKYWLHDNWNNTTLTKEEWSTLVELGIIKE